MAYKERRFSCDEAKRICKRAFETGTECGSDPITNAATPGWNHWLEENESLLFTPMELGDEDACREFREWYATAHEHVCTDPLREDDEILTCVQVRHLCEDAFDSGFRYGIEQARHHEFASHQHDWDHWLERNHGMFPTMLVVEDVPRLPKEKPSENKLTHRKHDTKLSRIFAKCAKLLKLADKFQSTRP